MSRILGGLPNPNFIQDETTRQAILPGIYVNDERLGVFFASVAETGSASDAPSATVSRAASISETGVAGDTNSATAVYLVSVNESTTATDASDGDVSSGTDYPVTVNESSNQTRAVADATIAARTILLPTPQISTTDIANVWYPTIEGADFQIDCPHAILRTHYDLVTAITNSLFSNRLALEDDELPNPFSADRMGYWGDPYLTEDDITGQRLGSRLWLLTRTKSSNTLLPTSKGYVEESLDWLVQKHVASSFTVDTYFINDMSKLGIDIVVNRPNNDPLTLLYSWAWDQVPEMDADPMECVHDDEPPAPGTARWHCIPLELRDGMDGGLVRKMTRNGLYAVGNSGNAEENYGELWDLNTYQLIPLPPPDLPAWFDAYDVSEDASVVIALSSNDSGSNFRVGYYDADRNFHTITEPGPDGAGSVNALSPDGTFGVGNYWDGVNHDFYRPAYWNIGDPTPNPLPYGGTVARGMALSDDTMVIVGEDYVDDETRAVKWTGPDHTETVLPGEWSSGYGVHPDGSVVVGTADNAPAYWPDDTTVITLPQFPGAEPIYGIGVYDISDDKTVLVGAAGAEFEDQRAAVWTNGEILALPGPDNDDSIPFHSSQATGISGDGTVAVGYGIWNDTEVPVVWKYY